MIRESADTSQTKRESRGCIDLGSSKFRLLVVEGRLSELSGVGVKAPDDLSFREEKRYVGWGEDLVETGSVSPAGAARAARVLCGLVERARAWGCPAPLLVATNTLREAENEREVRASLEAACGLPIRVLDQREEAEMGYVGAASFRAPGEKILLIDLGGTSTEISWGKGVAMEGYRGIPWGTHRVRRLLTGPHSFRRAARILAECLGGRQGEISARGGRVSPLPAISRDPTILMTGGTAVSLAICLRSMCGRGTAFEEMDTISLADVALVRARLTGLFRAGRERRLPLDEDRIGLLPSGLLLIEALLGLSSISLFRVTARDVRWGVVLTGGGS